MIELDLKLSDGRALHAYDARDCTGPADLAVFWHHGTPNVGEPPQPLFQAAAKLGIGWVSYDRPGYGGSSRSPGRNVASAAADVAAIADALGIDRFAVVGHSGGGPHALACAALLPERVLGVVCLATLAPYAAPGLDWFGDMAASGAASLRAAVDGRTAKERYEATDVEYDPEFSAADRATLAGEWSWLAGVARAGMETGPGGLIDDDLAYVAPWGFDPAHVLAPVLLVHGSADRVAPSTHSRWLASRCRSAELWLAPAGGHISVLNSAAAALDWLHAHAGGDSGSHPVAPPTGSKPRQSPPSTR